MHDNGLRVEETVDTVRRYRSGEAAKLVDMPAATLRIWEQRYGVVSPPTSASGQRLYSDVDVHRLKTIKALVNRGHAISSIAHLDGDQLRQLASGDSDRALTTAPMRDTNLFIVGFGESATLEMPKGVNAVRLDTVQDIPSPGGNESAANCLVIRVEALHEDVVLSIVTAAQRLVCDDVLVVYSFGTTRAAELARLEGINLKRAPNALLHANDLLAEYLQTWRRSDSSNEDQERIWRRTPRRFDNDTLTSVVSRSTTIACECPKHLAELVLQIAAFERYSDECESRSPADALLHRHLGDAANKAVAMFEAALAAVAEHEGWPIPATTPGDR
ncbi:MerR family transcriptional regulator [Pandoraea cepalis]|uniref:MerR family transcriptional regulator n=1 Tax=Pandoraea cepalis TaxID=2508294 RepID=A0AAW7MG93_9BURK|nr:MerR family transcriptional regulator [Pandoraea cepalis]MDN4576618.1 MerR family transcriptional regulator [Pandoraea cepalis]